MPNICSLLKKEFFFGLNTWKYFSFVWYLYIYCTLQENLTRIHHVTVLVWILSPESGWLCLVAYGYSSFVKWEELEGVKAAIKVRKPE